MIKRACWCFGILLTCFSAFAELSVRLTVEPSRVLPGVSPSLHLVLTNDGAEVAAVPSKVLLRVIPSDGKPFLAEFGAGQEHRYANAALPVAAGQIVKAHSSLDVWFRSYTLDRCPGWFFDARLDVPGTYRLQILLLSDYREETLGRAAALDAERAVPVELASSEAVLVVDVPRGGDADLARSLAKIAHRHGASAWSPLYAYDPEWREFVRSAVEEHPSSPYAAYVVRDYVEGADSVRLAPEQRLQIAQRVLSRQPQTLNRDDIQLFMAQLETDAAEDAARYPRFDAPLALNWYHRARADFEALQRSTTDSAIRAQSAAGLERLPSDADVTEKIAEQKRK